MIQYKAIPRAAKTIPIDLHSPFQTVALPLLLHAFAKKVAKNAFQPQITFHLSLFTIHFPYLCLI
jgi:hypothetical protein